MDIASLPESHGVEKKDEGMSRMLMECGIFDVFLHRFFASFFAVHLYYI